MVIGRDCLGRLTEDDRDVDGEEDEVDQVGPATPQRRGRGSGRSSHDGSGLRMKMG